MTEVLWMTIDSAFQKVVEVQRRLADPRNRRIVGARIRLLRAERDIGQNELAQRVNFHNSKMCKLENGAQPLTPEDAAALSEALAVSLDKLLSLSSEDSEHASV